MILSMFDYLEAELDTCGFFPAGKKPVMTANLRDILHRLDMTDSQAKITTPDIGHRGSATIVRGIHR